MDSITRTQSLSDASKKHQSEQATMALTMCSRSFRCKSVGKLNLCDVTMLLLGIILIMSLVVVSGSPVAEPKRYDANNIWSQKRHPLVERLEWKRRRAKNSGG